MRGWKKDQDACVREYWRSQLKRSLENSIDLQLKWKRLQTLEGLTFRRMNLSSPILLYESRSFWAKEMLLSRVHAPHFSDCSSGTGCTEFPLQKTRPCFQGLTGLFPESIILRMDHSAGKVSLSLKNGHRTAIGGAVDRCRLGGWDVYSCSGLFWYVMAWNYRSLGILKET